MSTGAAGPEVWATVAVLQATCSCYASPLGDPPGASRPGRVRCACGVVMVRMASPLHSRGCVDGLVTAAVQLGAESVAGWSDDETALVARSAHARVDVGHLQEQIAAGGDPLGDAFCRLRNSDERRGLGQTYTPPGIVASMMEWAASEVNPARVVDPGSGSGRFAVAAGRRF